MLRRLLCRLGLHFPRTVLRSWTSTNTPTITVYVRSYRCCTCGHEYVRCYPLVVG